MSILEKLTSVLLKIEPFWKKYDPAWIFLEKINQKCLNQLHKNSVDRPTFPILNKLKDITPISINCEPGAQPPGRHTIYL